MSDAKAMIQDINRAVSEDTFNLSEWEADFIESVGRRLQAGQELTEKQDEVLLRIWRRATE